MQLQDTYTKQLLVARPAMLRGVSTSVSPAIQRHLQAGRYDQVVHHCARFKNISAAHITSCKSQRIQSFESQVNKRFRVKRAADLLVSITTASEMK
jgi:hypothetical protein